MWERAGRNGERPPPPPPPLPRHMVGRRNTGNSVPRTDSLSMAGKKKKIKRADPRILEKAMATHSSTLAWKIPWTEEPGRLQYTGSLGVTHE